MRLENHPILHFDRSEKIEFTFNGKKIEAYKGDTIAAALHAAGIRVYGHTAKQHHARGLFCAIGNCSSCFMTVNGEPNVRVCVTEAEDGMVVEEQNGGKGAVVYE